MISALLFSFWLQTARAVPAVRNVAYQPGPKSQMLDLYFPSTPPPFKTVMLIHGGCFIWGSKDEADHMAQVRRIVEMGYAVASLNYRLAVPNFQNPHLGLNLYPAALEDVEDAFCWLKENSAKYSLQENRIAAVGFSAGGTLAAYLGTSHTAGSTHVPKCKIKPAAIVDFFGRTDFLHTTERPIRNDGLDCGENFVGRSRDDSNPPPQFHDADVLTHTDPLTAAPSLLLHGSNDLAVSVENSLRFCSRLESKCELKVLPGADHMFTHPDDMDKAFVEVSRFLKSRLDSQTASASL